MNPILKVLSCVKRGIIFSTWGVTDDGKLRQEELDSYCVNDACLAHDLREDVGFWLENGKHSVEFCKQEVVFLVTGKGN